MVTERGEREPSSEKKKDKEEIKSPIDVIKAAFKKIIEKIKELAPKEKREEITPEEKKILESCRKERDHRKTEFCRTPEGEKIRKRIEEIRREVDDILDKPIDNLRHLSEDKLDESLGKIEQDLREQGEKTERHWLQEDDKIKDERYKGIVESGLEWVVRKKEKKRDEILRGRGIQIPDKEVLAQNGRNLERAIREHGVDSPEAQAEIKKSQEAMGRLGSRFRWTEEEKEQLKNKEDRKKMFLNMLKTYGSDPGRHFREVPWETQTRWQKFMLYLSEKHPNESEKYLTRFSFEEQVHNLENYLDGEADITKINDIVRGFRSKDFDAAISQIGAVAAFRAYEQAYKRLALIDGVITPSKATEDARTGKNWVKDWVKEQVEKTLKDYCKEHEKLDYGRDFAPYQSTFLRTGEKIFSFTLRGDEIQAELPGTRSGEEIGAPKRENLSRVLDPLQLPLRYWEGWHGVEGVLGTTGGKDLATALYTFYTGDATKKFEDKEEWIKAMKELKQEGMLQFNLFEIGGILSVSHWRAREAIRNVVPDELNQFMGMEMERKTLIGELKKEYEKAGLSKEKAAAKAEVEAKRRAFEHGLIRNPFGVFLSAEQEDKDAVLRACDVKLIDLSKIDKEKEKEEYEKAEKTNKKERENFFAESKNVSIYDDMSQALQRLVYRQTQELYNLLYDKDEPRLNKLSRKEKEEFDKEVGKFVNREENVGLNFDFVEDSEQKKKLEGFVVAIRQHFGQNEALNRLAKKETPFSIGAEDTPLELFKFVDLGDDVLQRRFRDLHGCAKAVGSFFTFLGSQGLILQKDEEIVKSLKEIQTGMTAYGFHGADTMMLSLADRVLKLVAEDKWQRSFLLPWPLCEMRDKGTWPFSGLTSKAEELFGQQALSYTKEEMRLLVEKLIGAGLFAGMEAKDVRREFYKEHKLGRGYILWEKVKRYGPGVLVGLIASAILIVIKEVVKDIEETTKEA